MVPAVMYWAGSTELETLEFGVDPYTAATFDALALMVPHKRKPVVAGEWASSLLGADICTLVVADLELHRVRVEVDKAQHSSPWEHFSWEFSNGHQPFESRTSIYFRGLVQDRP